MTGALLALLLAGLPEGGARYRFELGGEPVGVVTLAVRCDREGGTGSAAAGAGRCLASWASETRLPAEAGGQRRSERFERLVDREGNQLEPAGPPPAFLLELLFRDAGAKERCRVVSEERSGRRQRGCGRRGDQRVVITLDGEPEHVTYEADGFPARIDLPLQRTRFVRDPAAAPPPRPPRLFGVEVPGPLDPTHGARWCGVARDRSAAEADAGVLARLPRPAPSLRSCREQAQAWVEAARAAGERARVAVGVAWLGGGWWWHEWAEVESGGRWVPVDPASGQWPARSVRFTLARWAPGDEAAEAAAGRAILDCWGKARVEP